MKQKPKVNNAIYDAPEVLTGKDEAQGKLIQEMCDNIIKLERVLQP